MNLKNIGRMLLLMMSLKRNDKALTTEFAVQFASMYLSQHYTSTRVKQLVDIVTGI